MLRRHFDEIAQHVVVADLQSADLRLLGITCLQCSNDAPRFITQRAHFVERRVITVADEAAVALERRQFIGQCRCKDWGQRGVWLAQGRGGAKNFRRCLGHALQPLRQRGGGK